MNWMTLHLWRPARLARGVHALLVLSIILFVCPLARAQFSASIMGVVADSSGAALPGVQITAENTETGLRRAVTSDASGRYVFVALPVGRYRIRAAKDGFDTQLRTGVTLAVGQEAEVDLKLGVGAMKQQVTVRGEAPALNTTTSQVSGIVGERQVKDLPLNGRSFDELMTLNPGIANYTSQKTGGVGISNSAVGNMFAVSGHRPQDNLFLLNGIEYTGAAEINLQPGGTSGQLLGVDAIREFNVETNTYGAEYGKRPGAQVNIVTSSGTNQLHGSLYEFLRNSAFDARNFFDRGQIPGFERNQFGASLGGPIQPDKTFFFANYEGYQQRLGLSDLTLAPDQNARNGLLPNGSGGFTNVGIGPGVAPLLSLWPVANGPDLGGGIAEAFSHPLQAVHENFGTTRLDHIFSDRDSLSGVYTLDDSGDSTPTQNPLSLDVEYLREQVASLQETHAASNSTINVARLGYSRAGYFYTGEPTVSVPGFIQGDPMSALVIGGGTASNSAAQISLAGSNIGSHLFATRNLYTADDQAAITRGIHQITLGGWFQDVQANDELALGQYGQAVFSSLTAFLQGNVTVFSAVPSPTPEGWRSRESAGFVQDAMRLRPNLLLTLGFRDESTNGWSEATGRGANYLFDTNQVIETTPLTGHSMLTVNHARFLPEPRAGLAWQPFAGGKTSIHAGFGIYDDLQDDLSFRLDSNAPFNTTLILKNAPVSTLNVIPGAPLPSNGLVSPGGVQPSLYTPTVLAYTFKIEQELTPDTVLSVGYVGSHGYHEIVSLDANTPFPSVCPAAACPASLAAGTIYILKGAPLANPALANTWSWFSEGNSSYNALEADLNHRFSHGLQFRAVYTWAKSLDNGDTLNGSAAANAPGTAMDPLNLGLDYGLSTFDVRNLAVMNGSYDLPFGHGQSHLAGFAGWKDKVVSGWSVDAIETLQSGFPFTPQLSFNPSNNGDTRNPVRPSFNPLFQGPVILGSPNQYFNPNAFVVPANGTYGNVGRDTFIGPGLTELDLALLKDTAINERVRMEFRAEFFNLFNSANFNIPNLITYTSPSGPPSSSAGVITSTATTSRQIQFGLKLIW
jgi:hypothetical protein